jgi:aldose 1-epimerase
MGRGATMSIDKKFYGITPDGKTVDLFTLTNSNGMQVEIINYGGIVVSLKVPDSKGNFKDVVLGYNSLEKYMVNAPFFGGIIGRHANRIGNSCFQLNGVEYKLAANDGANHLHGGSRGFHKVVWEAQAKNNEQGQCLELSYTSKDMEEGYPGNLEVKVMYILTEDNALAIDYFAVSDKDTVVNLTNHSYFNLSGHASGDILKHKVRINAKKLTENDQYSIPTGEIKAVAGTPMDFTELTPIDEGIFSDYYQIVYGKGYDHNWVLDLSGKEIEKAAEVLDEASGRVMEVYTNKPGIQFYSGNFLDGSVTGKEGAVYSIRTGLCLETQFFPNGINQENFPSPILRAGESYKYTTIYKFSTV